MSAIIKIENLSKKYRLGMVGTSSLAEEFHEWWDKLLGKEQEEIDFIDNPLKGKIHWALKNTSFEVTPGEVVGIIGKNGAGKSTLLKILSKVTTPTSGTVKVKGRIASLLEVGTGFHGELSGKENIYLNGAILGMDKREIDKKYDEIVDFSGVEKFIDTPVKRYSSGMYVRLAFAVAAHLDPDILIIDEVLAVGDADFQKKCLGKMKDVSVKEGRTVLFVSHNVAAVSALCDRGILLRNGAIVFDGKVDDALKEYLIKKDDNSGGIVRFTGLEPERFGEKKYGVWQSVTLINQDEIVTDHFLMGDKMKIRLEIDILTPSDDFEIGVAINNFQEVSIHYFVSPWEGFTSISSTGRKTLEVEMPQVNLFPGRYTFIVWIALRGAYYDDAIHGAINFTVAEGKVNEHDTYFERFSKNTQVYTPSKWSVK